MRACACTHVRACHVRRACAHACMHVSMPVGLGPKMLLLHFLALQGMWSRLAQSLSGHAVRMRVCVCMRACVSLRADHGIAPNMLCDSAPTLGECMRAWNACVRACMHACVRARVSACMCARVD